MTRRRTERAWVIGLSAVHAALLAGAAVRLSPTVDEVAHLPAGVRVWDRGTCDLYRVNPPLVKVVAAAPVVAAGCVRDWSPLVGRDRPGDRPEWDAGSAFLTANGPRSLRLFTLARWAVIPFSLLGAWAVWRWGRALYGRAAGVTACGLWCLSPAVLGHACLITPDAAAAGTGVWGGYLFWRHLRRPGWWTAAAAGLALGVMQLTKFTWVAAFGLWPTLWLAYRWAGGAADRRREPWRTGAARQALIPALGLCVLNAGYGFAGTGRPLGAFTFVSRTLAGDDAPGNRFAPTPLGRLPVPVPADWLRGVDVQRVDFETPNRSYLFGRWRAGGWWHYYLSAWAVKTPLGTWLLAGFAVAAWVVRPRAPPRDELVLLAPPLAVFLLVSGQTNLNDHPRYVLPCVGFACVFAGQSACRLRRGGRLLPALHAAGLAATAAATLSCWPFCGAYFNLPAGGPGRGYRHLSRSGLEWGEGLLELRRWLDAHPAVPLDGLAQYGRCPPALCGLPAVAEPPRLPRPGWWAVSGTRLTEPAFTAYRTLRPAAVPGGVIFLFHVPGFDGEMRSGAGKSGHRAEASRAAAPPAS